METGQIRFDLREFDEVPSTNSLLKDMADNGALEGLVVLAHHQTGGRGRLGRTWNDEPGTNLLFSVLLRPPIAPERFPLLAFYACLAVAEAISSHTGIRVDAKWPNDLLLDGKKVCGILLESSQDVARSPYAIIGVGLNVNQRGFPSDLQDLATSLALTTGRTYDRAGLLRTIFVRLDALYGNVRRSDFSQILSAWQQRAIMFGRTVTVLQGDGERVGTARALAADGGLIVEFDGVPTTSDVRRQQCSSRSILAIRTRSSESSTRVHCSENGV
jgi:BirA family biotin operon repressor/biotin-[acetyl-CoA-carboxylase] ligase